MEQLESLPKCCCRWGSARSGEWPEFQCRGCQVHIEDLMVSRSCARHKAES
jgi:hypothetical protein